MNSTIRALALCLLAAPAGADPLALTVTAVAETEGTSGDADDPAIWVNPTDPARSLILGADKEAGLYAYDLAGAQVAFLPDGRLNNVDLRPFMLDGQAVTLVGSSRRDDGAMVFHVIGADGTIRQAAPFAHPAANPQVPGTTYIYGFAMAQDAGGTYALVNFKSGHILQYRISEADGQLALTLERHWQVATQPEGMFADDAAGHIYVGEEDVGIWRFPLSPEAAPEPFVVDAIPSACLPRDDVEGLALHDDGTNRWLVASAQGVDRAAIYRLRGEDKPDCVALVEVAAGALDRVTETDGLDVTATPLGPAFPQGLLVMMDDQNAGFTTGFKLVNWVDVAAGLPK
jgi:3-phytase